MSETPDPLNEAWKDLIATALRRNAVVAVGEHRAAVEAAVLAARPSPAEPPAGDAIDREYEERKQAHRTEQEPSPAEPPAGDLREAIEAVGMRLVRYENGFLPGDAPFVRDARDEDWEAVAAALREMEEPR